MLPASKADAKKPKQERSDSSSGGRKPRSSPSVSRTARCARGRRPGNIFYRTEPNRTEPINFRKVQNRNESIPHSQLSWENVAARVFPRRSAPEALHARRPPPGAHSFSERRGSLSVVAFRIVAYSPVSPCAHSAMYRAYDMLNRRSITCQRGAYSVCRVPNCVWTSSKPGS